MSFEDDEYWDEEYSDNSTVSNAAVAQERRFVQRDVPEPIIPTRRAEPLVPARRAGAEPVTPGYVDERAARRKRRAAGGAPARKPTGAFDTQRPSWLDDPDFV